MKIVTIDVRTLADTLADAAEAMETLAPSGPRISFASPELLWDVMTAERWGILRAMAGAGALTLREVARRVGRDVEAAQGDVHVLLDAGLIDQTGDGNLVFPYDAVHVDFLLRAA